MMYKLTGLFNLKLNWFKYFSVFLVLIFLGGCSTVSDLIETIKPPTKSLIGTGQASDKLIVVATAIGLNNNGKSIQQAFNKVLKPYLSKELPFTLLIIGAGGKIINLFPNWNQIENHELLWQEISKNMRFGHFFNSLKNLRRVKEEYPKSFNQILYLTDNGGIPSNLDELDQNLLNGLKSWGSKITVLTSKSCDIWEDKLNVAQCTKLSGQRDIKNTLNNF